MTGAGTIDLVLVGFGHVAQRFVTLLDEQRRTLAHDYALHPRVVAIATGRHGQIVAPAGVDAPALAARVARGESLGRAPFASTRSFITSVARSPRLSHQARRGRLVVVETTTLDIERGQPAIDHVAAALGAGAHVITANKGPVAFAYRRLDRAASRARRRFLFEGAVMDGIPLFNLVRETLPAVRVLGVRGVVNSTTNYILTAMERGHTFEQALAEMQAAGTAEADASLDIDGWDAAAKTAALANVLLDGRITPREVDRHGVRDVTPTRVSAALMAGRRLKLLASAERSGRGVRARVGPVELPMTDLLAGLEREQNALVLQTDLLGEIGIVQRGAGLTATAYALLSDLVTIARGLSAGAAARSPRSARSDRSRPAPGRRRS